MEDMVGKAIEPKELEQFKKDLENSLRFCYTLTEESPIFEWKSDDDPTVAKKLIVEAIAGRTTHLSLEVEPGNIQHYATICKSQPKESSLCCLVFHKRVVFCLTGPGPVNIFGHEVIKDNNEKGLWEGIKDFFGGSMFNKKAKLKEN